MSDPSTPPDASGRRRRRTRILGFGALGLFAVFLLIQLVPYGRTDHTNPPATKTLALDGQTRQIFTEACADCHSNDTKWLWYTNVAPVSWLVQNDVNGGRAHMNVSEWDKPQPELREIREVIAEGEMPPLQYKLSPYHWNARLSDTEKRTLIDGLTRAYTADPPPVRQEGGGG